jgi:hypothetical protein
VGRIADLELFRPFGEERRIFLDQRSSDEVAAGGHANLASVVERPEAPDPCCVLEVCIRQDHQRRVAAQLQMQPLEKRRREPRHFPSCSHRPRERDHGNVGMGNQFSSDPAPGKHMQQIRGQARLLKQAREHDTTADRCPGIRLKHNRVTQSQRGRQRACVRRGKAER